MKPLDLTNGTFELIGGAMTWLNVAKLRKDKVIHGVDWRVTFFWFAWGVWNLFYYPMLGQPVSFIGGIALAAGNATWVGLALYYKYFPAPVLAESRVNDPACERLVTADEARESSKPEADSSSAPVKSVMDSRGGEKPFSFYT